MVLADPLAQVSVSQGTWVIQKTPLSTIGLISLYSALYGVSSSTLYSVLKCESKLRAGAIGDNGTSFGIAQIHLSAHPDVSKEEALNMDFSIQWAAKQFSLGHASWWSCYTILGFNSP